MSRKRKNRLRSYNVDTSKGRYTVVANSPVQAAKIVLVATALERVTIYNVKKKVD